MIATAFETLSPVAMFGLSSTELIIILVVVVLLFGAKRIPDLGKSVGQGIRNFKKGLRDAEKDEQHDAEEDGDDEAKPRKALDADEVQVLEADDATTKRRSKQESSSKRT